MSQATRRLPSAVAPLLAVLPLVGLLPLLVPPTPAFGGGQRAAEPSMSVLVQQDKRAVALLRRASRAQRSVGYAGTVFVSAWGPGGVSSTVLDVRRVPGLGTAVRTRAADAGAGSETFASEADVVLDGTNGGPVRLLVRSYEVRVDPFAERVAGRATDVVEAWHVDGPLAARLWLDEATGLLVRREVYGPDGTTTSASAFVDVRMTGWGFPVQPVPATDDPTSRAAAPQTLASMRASGWTCPRRLAGAFVAYRAATVDGSSGPALHLTYSDGLSTVSVFEEKGTLDPSGLVGAVARPVGDTIVYSMPGGVSRLTWQSADRVFTVVADAPPQTVEAVVAALPQGEAHGSGTGFLDRMSRGASLVGTWLNPFG